MSAYWIVKWCEKDKPLMQDHWHHIVPYAGGSQGISQNLGQCSVALLRGSRRCPARSLGRAASAARQTPSEKRTACGCQGAPPLHLQRLKTVAYIAAHVLKEIDCKQISWIGHNQHYVSEWAAFSSVIRMWLLLHVRHVLCLQGGICLLLQSQYC